MGALGTALLLCGLSACSDPATTRPPPVPGAGSAALPAAARELTILYTTDEHGWILPRSVEGTRRGGVSHLLSRLVAEEGHCPGTLPNIDAPPTTSPGAEADRADPCEHSDTVLLSGGDNYTGPAITGYFQGRNMAACMRRLGYSAAAFGNHELDYGREAFAVNQKLAGIPYLSANLQRADGAPPQITLPYAVVHRAGLKLGVIGLSTPATPKTAVAHRFAGLVFGDLEEALGRTVDRVWQRGVDAVAVIAHECHDVLHPIVAAHPEWRLSFVGAGHCHRTSVELAGQTPIICPGWRLEHYARVRIRITPAAAPRERASVIGHELVEVVVNEGDAIPNIDPRLEEHIAAWRTAMEGALGEVIGFSESGLPLTSAALAHWVLRSWRQRFAADVALTSQGALRQELPAGPITRATIYSILPFENELVVCRIPGSALQEMLRRPSTRASGVEERADASLWVGGGPLDPQQRYTVVVTDFLYYGGDDYRFRELDPKPTTTGVGWRDPVVTWTKEQQSAPGRPLERLLLR